MNKKVIIIVSIVVVCIVSGVILFVINKNNDVEPTKVDTKVVEDASVYNLKHNKEAYSSIKIESYDKNANGFLNERGLKKVENSLVNITDDGKINNGLYYSNGISIDNINNAYLIAFNIKKYLKESFKEDELYSLDNAFPEGAINTWKWDKCFSNNCLGEEELDYHKIMYIISKDEFNNYMHKTYNTTNNYDLFKVNEEETSDIVMGCTTIDSSDKYYTLVYNEGCHDTPIYDIKTQITDSKEDNNSLVLYNKIVICSTDPQGGSCETIMDANENNIIESCNWETDTDYEKCSSKRVFQNHFSQLNTFKHTFKKINGNYYWVKSELVK